MVDTYVHDEIMCVINVAGVEPDSTLEFVARAPMLCAMCNDVVCDVASCNWVFYVFIGCLLFLFEGHLRTYALS